MSKSMPSGIGRNAFSLATTSSANEPMLNGSRSPNTRSPGVNLVTPGPTASTVPATSVPRRGFVGLRRPTKARMNWGRGPM